MSTVGKVNKFIRCGCLLFIIFFNRIRCEEEREKDLGRRQSRPGPDSVSVWQHWTALQKQKFEALRMNIRFVGCRPHILFFWVEYTPGRTSSERDNCLTDSFHDTFWIRCGAWSVCWLCSVYSSFSFCYFLGNRTGINRDFLLLFYSSI